MLDFRNVKTMAIPEGNVMEISVGGITLWRAEQETDVLPSGYRRLKYIQSSGAQQIDTGYDPVKNTSIEIGYEYTAIPSGSFYYVFGNYQAAGRACCRLMTNRSTDQTVVNMYTAADQANLTITAAKVVGTRYDDILTNASYTTNGTTHEVTNTKEGTSTTRNLALFANYVGGRKTSMKLYYCRIKEGDTLVRDFIPCLDADSVPCLYDAVRGDTYYNGGTGDFDYELEE